MDVLVLNEEVVQLEQRLSTARDAERLTLLVNVAWHLRQRNTARAVAYADEASALCNLTNLPDTARARIDARLELVRAEAKWLFAEFDSATAKAGYALKVFSAIPDHAGCADAHWLLASIAGDRGNTSQRDAEYILAADSARRAGDMLRLDLAEAAQARWAVLRDVRAAEAQWADRFPADMTQLHPGLKVWVADIHGMYAFKRSDFARAASYRMLMQEAAEATGQVERLIIAITNVGGCFGNLNDFQAALEWMSLGLETARQTGWPGSLGVGLMQTADTQRNLGRLQAAHDLLVEALEVLKPFHSSRRYAVVLHYMGDLAIDRGDYAAALSSFQQYEELVAALNEPAMQTTAKRGQAHALSSLGRAGEALAAANASLARATEHKNPYDQIEALKVLAMVHADHALPSPPDMIAPNASLHYLNQALNVAAMIEGYIVPGGLLDAIAREYARIGDTAQAYAVSLQAIAAREKTNSAEAINRAVATQIRHQTERARAEAEHHRQLAESEARRAETLLKMTATLEHLGAIGQELTTHLDVKVIFQALNRHVHGLLDAHTFSVFLLSPDGTALDCVYGIENDRPLPAIRVNLDHPSANIARCARERVEIIKEQRLVSDHTNVIPGTQPSGSALFAPLSVGKRLLGVMTIQSSHTHAYAERERLIFRTLCAYGAIALDNASAYRQLEASLTALSDMQKQLVEKNSELEQMSLTDPLTGLRNRRFLQQHIEKDVAMTLRRTRDRLKNPPDEPVTDTDLVFFMVDVDHFKSVNDQYGHTAGDMVLIQMKDCLQNAVRETDHVIRWGGEEFLVVARNTDRLDAEVIAERIRQGVATHVFQLPHGVQLRRTCSVGFACFPFVPHNLHLLTWSQVVQLADQCLYIAKKAGRDAWVGLHGSEQTRPEAIFDRLITNTDQVARDGEVRIVTSRGAERQHRSLIMSSDL